MAINKRLINTGSAAPAPFDPLANFETVTYTGTGAAQAINGYIRKGAAFNGSSSVISIPLSIVSVSSAYSVSLWFNAVNVGINTGIFTNQGSSPISGQIAINLISSTQINVASIVNNGSNTVDAIAATVPTMSANNWNHLVVIGDRSLSNKVKLYLNGTEASNYSFNAGAGSNTLYSTAQIGRSDNRFFNGKLDQIRFFNSSITQANITTLKNETYASATKSTTDIFGNGSGTSLYQLEDNANDTGVAIDSGQSGVFNGTNSEISLGNSNSFSYTTTGALSVNMWIKTTNTSTAYVVSKANDSSGQYEWAIEQLANGTLSLHAYTNAGGFASTINNTTIINDGNWHNVVGVIVNNTSTTLYIDRTSATSTSFSGTGASYSIPTLIGHFGGIPAATAWFEGEIDQVRLYSSALSAADVTNIYNETNIPSSNFVSWYKLDGNANDSKGSNNGTWAGTEAYSTPAIRNYKGENIAINYLGMAFKPDFVWVKQRSSPDRGHILSNSVSSASSANSLAFMSSHNSEREYTGAEAGGAYIRSLDSNGFSVGNSNFTGASAEDYVSWCWRAAASTTTITANSVGNTIASDVRANVASGFSIASYTGNNTQNATVAHGLGAEPKLLFIKRTDVANAWWIPLPILGSNKFMEFSAGSATTDSQYQYTQTSDIFKFTSASQSAQYNASGGKYIMYSFADILGYQKVGTYQGDNNSLQTIATGFQVRFVLIKAYDGTTNWEIFDSTRGGNKGLQANVDAAEFSNSSNFVSFLSNGFEVSSINHENTNGKNYIYLAIA